MLFCSCLQGEKVAPCAYIAEAVGEAGHFHHEQVLTKATATQLLVRYHCYCVLTPILINDFVMHVGRHIRWRWFRGAQRLDGLPDLWYTRACCPLVHAHLLSVFNHAPCALRVFDSITYACVASNHACVASNHACVASSHACVASNHACFASNHALRVQSYRARV
jgi:hypothetical protein